MARTNVNFEAKKQDLLTSIWNILLKYGYEEMTISVIMKELSISRGAFYHYFQSKEACVDAAIEEYVNRTVRALESMDVRGEGAPVRLKCAIQNGVMLFHGNVEQDRIINQPENAVFHQKLMIAFTKYLSPFYAAIIDDGIKAGEFDTAFPVEVAEMLLTLSNFYLDSQLFHWKPESIAGKIAALEELANKALNTKEYISFFKFERQV